MIAKAIASVVIYIYFGLMVSGQSDSASSSVHFSIGKFVYHENDTVIQVSRLGESPDKLLTCHTDLKSCCRGIDLVGEWFYPNGSVIQEKNDSIAHEHSFFSLTKNGSQAVKLARLRTWDLSSLVGSYCCQVSTTQGVKTLCASLVLCPLLKLPETNGKEYKYSDPYNRVGSTAALVCESGYYTNYHSTCLDNGHWEAQSEPICSVGCRDVLIPTQGHINYTDTVNVGARMPGTEVEYSCDGSKRICGHDGHWESPPPTCAFECLDLPSIVGGSIEYSNEMQNRRPSGTIATYTCLSGHIYTRTCQVNGTWSEQEPTCQKRCQDLAAPSNGNVMHSAGSKNRRPINSTANYTCSIGYTLLGQTTRECQRNGSWSNADVICIVTTCSELTPPVDVSISYSSESRHVNSTATYSCGERYTLSGSGTRVCQHNQTWSGIEASCQLITCPYLRSPAKGSLTYNESGSNKFPLGTMASYSCNHGYRLSGNRERICQIYETWSGTRPTCEAIICSLLDVTNGQVTYSDNKRSVDTVANYSCNSGFTLEGTISRTCQSSGVWSETASICTENTCRDLELPGNGSISYNLLRKNDRPAGTTATYSCSYGFTLHGNSTRVCRKDETWTGAAPSCILTICNDLEALDNGMINYTSDPKLVGAVAIFSCKAGYTLSGESTRVCQNDTKWSGSSPNCSLITCPNLVPPVNGSVNYSHDHPVPANAVLVDTEATYHCNYGYYLQGIGIIHCQSDGTWSKAETPMCKAIIQCSDLQNPSNGMIQYNAPGSLDKRPARTVATYSCSLGFELSGANNRTCNFDGSWTTAEDPTCEEIQITDERVLESLTSDTSDFVTNSINNEESQTTENLGSISKIFNKIAKFVRHSDVTLKRETIEDMVSIINYLGQWMLESPSMDITSSIVQSYETIVERAAQQGSQNFSFSEVFLVIKLSKTNDLQTQGSSFASDSRYSSASIKLPTEVFKSVSPQTPCIGSFYAIYESSFLFPIQKQVNTTRMTTVGSPIIAATVGESKTIRNIENPVVIEFDLQKSNNTFVEGSEKCVSWSFSSNRWVDTGCKTFKTGDKVECQCTHLTNFAVLIDICSRAQDCESDRTAEDTLSVITYVGIVLSSVGLFLTIITLLAFKVLRKRDNTVHNVQLCIAIFVTLLVFASGIEQTGSYGGCVTVSVLIHYFSLVAVMWMGAEAVLMFQKLVIVFGKISTSYLVVVSLICWITPVVPVMITMIIDLLNGTEPENDLIINRNVTEYNDGYCFLRHSGVFFGGFLAPILAIILFNLIIFIWITVIVLRSTKGKLKRANKKLKPKKALRIMTSLFGVMTLFGLTWLSAAFTFTLGGSNVVRIMFQSLFVVCGTFQGVFIFFFFCVLDKKARYAWRYALCKKQPTPTSSFFNSSSTVRQSTLVGRKASVTSTASLDYTKVPYIPELKMRLAQNGKPMVHRMESIDEKKLEISITKSEENSSQHESDSVDEMPVLQDPKATETPSPQQEKSPEHSLLNEDYQGAEAQQEECPEPMPEHELQNPSPERAA